ASEGTIHVGQERHPSEGGRDRRAGRGARPPARTPGTIGRLGPGVQRARSPGRGTPGRLRIRLHRNEGPRGEARAMGAVVGGPRGPRDGGPRPRSDRRETRAGTSRPRARNRGPGSLAGGDGPAERDEGGPRAAGNRGPGGWAGVRPREARAREATRRDEEPDR